ncbi:MAG: toprim domain-containing protein [Caulobacterales bacterium]|nr:toprim domain-containing protein [Caulobacterales bacterium]
MTLQALVRRLGGDLYDGGRRANIPAPGHSRADRSVSLLLVEGRLVIHSFGAATWRDVRADLLRLGLIDGEGRLIGTDNGPSGGIPPGRGGGEAVGQDARRAAAVALWRISYPFEAETPAGLYCAARAATNGLDRAWAMRFAPLAPTSVYRPGRWTRPALICAIRDPSGELTAVEMTYLTAQGAVTSWLRTPRKSVGTIAPGSAVRLSRAAGDMVVGEGVFTTLSAMARFDLPGWALLSTRNLRRWTPPDGVRRVLVAADRGMDGEASAASLADSLTHRGVRAAIRLPPAPFGDWNDWAQDAAGGEEERGRRRGRLGAGKVPPGAGA